MSEDRTAAQPETARPEPPASMASPIRRLLAPALIGLVFGGGGVLLGRHARRSDWMASDLDALGAIDLLALPVMFFAVLLIHELGHLAGGLIRGMRFLLLIVGPLRLRRTVSGLKLDWFLSGQTFGGLAAAMPDLRRPLRAQLLPLIVGGPLASLLLAVAALGVSATVDGRIAAHLLILGAMSAMIFVATALPMRAGGFQSDGMQCIELVRGGPAMEQRALLMAVYAQSLAGVRPRDRDPAPLQRALQLRGDEPMRDTGAALMAYQAALDRRDLEAAGDWIDRVADGHDAYPAMFRQVLANEIAFFSARYRDDSDAATAWSARARGGAVEPSSRALTEAAIALGRGDTTLALRAIQRGELALSHSSDAGSIALLQDELSSLRADALALQARRIAS
jgi:hypothetical protein